MALREKCNNIAGGFFFGSESELEFGNVGLKTKNGKGVHLPLCHPASANRWRGYPPPSTLFLTTLYINVVMTATFWFHRGQDVFKMSTLKRAIRIVNAVIFVQATLQNQSFLCTLARNVAAT